MKLLRNSFNCIKQFVFPHVIRKSEIQQLEYKGQFVVMDLFQTFYTVPERLLPENTRKRWCEARERGTENRVYADYISGMTDEYASRINTNLFSPKAKSITRSQFY